METLSEYGKQRKRYLSARMNLILIIAFTVINLILLLAGGNTYFLFSAFVPYVLVQMGMIFCGKMPEEFYLENGMDTEYLLIDAVLYAAIALAVVCLLVYLLCWIFSKKQIGWLIAALVFFSIDTLALILFNGLALEQAIDVVFHLWVLISLIGGVIGHFKLQKMPEEFPEVLQQGAIWQQAEEAEAEEEKYVGEAPELFWSPVLRMADMDTKFRILAQGEAFGHQVVYRRVKKTNELVIDGNVYAEYVALLEFNHQLGAKVNGHLFEAEFNGTHSLIKVDGQIIAKKLRLY